MTERRLALLVSVLALLLTWACYAPAISGDFQLDDSFNLADLNRVTDFESGLNFTLSGEAGPLGRPISLATFALQAAAWQDGAAEFLTFNIFIHLFNAVVLAFCVFRLSLLLSFSRDRALSNAVLVATVWATLPLLATATLLVIQRMATLSSTFMLLGLAGYLLARSRCNDAPFRSLAWMSAALFLGTLLAILCKESGLLLPVFVLVLEMTLLHAPARLPARIWRSWQAAFLGVPLAVILTYLAASASYPEALALGRGFTGWERLFTEAQLLWVYLSKALIGSPFRLGIFQDAPTVATSFFQWTTLLACMSWIILTTLAIMWRRRFPLFAVAVLWFIAGHLIESTFVSLELYFEHRNYLAIVGPIFALSSWLLLQKRQVIVSGLVVVAAFVAMNAYFLFVFASLWGEPSMASRYWAMRYPDSVRAVTTMARYQLGDEGPVRTINTLESFVSRNPQHAYLRIQQLNLLCRIAPAADHSSYLQKARDDLPAVKFTYSAGRMFSQLFDAVIATQCATVDTSVLVGLVNILRDNPRYTGEPQYNQFHQKLLAAIARHNADSDAVLRHLRAAVAHGATSELNFMMVTALVDAGQFDEARAFMANARDEAPLNPLRAAKWHRDLDELLVYVDELEKARQ